MSSDSQASKLYSQAQYKSAVYSNLFNGIAYGQENDTLPIPPQLKKPSGLAYAHRCLYRSIRYLGLRPPVSCAFEGKGNTH
jgi:hypothetical protein